MFKKLLFLCLLPLMTFGLQAQEKEAPSINASVFSALKFRNIGPAFPSGRIADIAIHPDDENTWYVAVGSGGVWKTENAGTTWQSLFDGQSSYSTGCVTIDPSNPHTIWVGAGENVGGRHVGFGDGVYRSMDGGKSWKNMGLKASQHISRIIVHPENSNVVWVAAQGPLWNSGDERGLYKTTDGGKTWTKTLGDEEWTGVTDIVIDPRNPDVLYAATWQRHRTVAAYMGGGPKSGLHRSIDGGETWEKLSRGLPGGNIGKIGLAISPQNPDILYAAIEQDQAKGGIWKSTDRGSSWTKQSNTVSGGTGPHYYQELYASPHHFDRIYLMDVRIQVSDDGGKTFQQLGERDKHSDNHAIAFKASAPDYLLVGCDGGVYESYDHGGTWRFFDNLPIVQYYKVAVDDAEPFYNVYGGTQDNGSHGGPSRTDKSGGITNGDWIKTLGADGHQSATEPGNPNIMYAESQQGSLHRVDVTTGEEVFIQPQPREGEGYERYNWDAPILVSPHDPARLYFASYRVWRSDNRGDSWEPISGDLTRDQERMNMPIMGRVQSFDSPWDFNAMSNYNTITSLAESPLQEGLLYAGTDDGIIQVTEDGGANWRKIEVGSIDGIPATAFVNDIRADLHDANTVYACLDNHKYGDFKPYMIKSTNRGKSWKSISGNLPDRHLVWRMVQDHVKPELLFAATEFGIFCTIDGGGEWIQLKGGLPTISFRDITIQRRENDLVGASFGRGFFILDDYSPLREIDKEKAKEEALLFSTRKALAYSPRNGLGDLGAGAYAAENPPVGAVFTYYLSEGYTTLEAERKKEEARLNKEGKDIPFPGWEALDTERREEAPEIILTIKDQAGNVVNKLTGPARKGMHRVVWNLRYPSANAINPNQSGRRGWGGGGFPVTPGAYTVTLSKQINGQTTQLAGPITFEVERLYPGALQPASTQEMIAYREALTELQAEFSAVSATFSQHMSRLNAMETALERTLQAPGELDARLYALKQQMLDLQEAMFGASAKNAIGERTDPTVQNRLSTAYRGIATSYGPTGMHRSNMEIAQKELKQLKTQMVSLIEGEMAAVEKALIEVGAPWILGQPIKER